MMRPWLKIAAAHLTIDAVLLWLAYYWLGTGEGSVLTLVWSFLVAAVIVLATVCLQGATFAYFAGVKPAVRRLAPLLAVAAAAGAVYFLLSLWAGYSAQPAFRIASYLTLKLRKPIRPAAVLRVFNVVLWLIRWILIPVLVLPVIAWAASGVRRAKRSWMYWIEAPVLLLCAFWIPVKLWGWQPHVSSFWLEVTSFTLRMAVAYLCFIGAWLVLVFLTASGKPPVTQLKTVPSP